MIDDRALIEGYLEGDTNSFNRLAWKWQDKLYRFSYRYLMNEDDAKEAVQMALIKVYKNLKKLNDPDRFSSWIFQIQVNICKDMLKHPNRKKFVSINRELDNEDGRPIANLDRFADEQDLDYDVHRTNIEEIVKKTLSQIPEEQRVVIIMKEYQGLKFKEIAEILECPINTVKSRMYYGLQQMHKILTKLNISREVLFNEM
ncbi:RNA polymerase sigma factor [candidate division KSB1 bacterium]